MCASNLFLSLHLSNLYCNNRYYFVMSLCGRREWIDTLSTRVCDDMVNYILHIMCVSCIQRSFRKYMFRHTRRSHWVVLRHMILKAGGIHSPEFEILQSSRWIRKEWEFEPTSWMYMLKYEKDTLFVMVEEVVLRI